MATEAARAGQGRSGPRTERRDLWWVLPLTVVIVFSAFIIYTTWAALQDANYYRQPYLSPYYSPCLATHCVHTTIGIFGSWWALSPAILILAFPGGLRLTCYYYRKSYYRSFWLAPPACGVMDARKGYSGETRFPLVWQAIHRWFFWASLVVIAFLWWDVIEAFQFHDGFGIGLGTVIMFANVILLSLYSLSCHSCRYLVGGYLDRFFKAPVRYHMWRVVSRLNARHATYAWISLFSVALTDLYIRLVASGTLHDVRFF